MVTSEKMGERGKGRGKRGRDTEKITVEEKKKTKQTKNNKPATAAETNSPNATFLLFRIHRRAFFALPYLSKFFGID